MRLSRGFSFIAIIALTACFLSSCSERKVYDKYAHTTLSGWEKTDTLIYNVPSVEATDIYQLALGLRITNKFPFTALTMIVEQQFLPADTVVRDTLNCKLVDAKGNYDGGGINYYQYRFPISDMALQKGDSIHIRVRHDMKREVLEGVCEVGITLTP